MKAAIRIVVILLTLVSLGRASEALAQLNNPSATKDPRKEMHPTPAPNVLYERLIHPDPTSQFSADEQRMDVLGALGLGGNSFEEIRLTYDDLDGGHIPEALFTLQMGRDAVDLIVLKQEGNQWYHLASPDEFSCYCKYEALPLVEFAQVERWSVDESEPAKLLVVTENGGGTGLSLRERYVFALQGFELKKVFSVTEELRDCTQWTENPIRCDFNHVEINEVSSTEQPHALLAVSYQRKNVSADSWDDTWWIGLPIQTCTAYTWNGLRQLFVENAKATSGYCGHLGKPLIPPPLR